MGSRASQWAEGAGDCGHRRLSWFHEKEGARRGHRFRTGWSEQPAGSGAWGLPLLVCSLPWDDTAGAQWPRV